MDGVLSVFCNFDSWTAKTSISEWSRPSGSSMNFGRIPSAFHWKIFNFFREVVGTGWEGDELVDPGSWQFVGSDERFCVMLVYFSHFQWLSRVEAFGPVLHFWWNPLEHTLHLTGTLLERKAAKYLAYFSFELSASARDKPSFKRDLMMVELDEEVSCQVIMMDAKLLMVKSWDDSAKLWWRERVLLRFLWGLWIRYKWLQGDKHYRKMDLRNGKLDQHNGCG